MTKWIMKKGELLTTTLFSNSQLFNWSSEKITILFLQLYYFILKQYPEKLGIPNGSKNRVNKVWSTVAF